MGIWITCAELLLALTPPVAPREQAQIAVLSRPQVLVDFGLQPPASAGKLGYPRAADGLFYLEALVNDVPVRFLVDTGATSVVLTRQDADRAGIAIDQTLAQLQADTAGGKVAMTWTRAARLSAGPLSGRDVDIAVTGSGLQVSLLGQSWLSQFSSVTIKGNRLILEP